MSWNYRIMAIEGTHPLEKGEVFFNIHEVYYDDNMRPTKYSTNPVKVGGEDVEEIRTVLAHMIESLVKPILWTGYRFPAEYSHEEMEQLNK